jgi:integrase
MASIFRRKGGKNWQIKYKDEFGRWRTVAGYPDKKQSLEKATMLEHGALKRANGLVDQYEAPKASPLTEHLDAYERFLTGKGNSPIYVKQAVAQVKLIFEACEFERINDLLAHDATDRVGRFLAKLRQGSKDEPGISNETSNRYQTAIKGFVNWARKQGKMPHSPLADLPNLDVLDRGQRRAATAKQFAAILKAAKSGPETHGLTGEQRAMLYQVAAYTGLRASELAPLTPESFKLNAEPAHVVVTAATAKNRKYTEQPLPADLVKLLKPWLAGKPAGERLWPGRWHQRAAEMLRTDLTAANVPAATDEGIFDFHALRTTYITNLARGGVHPKIAQELARHSDIKLTMRNYTKLGKSEIAAGLARLPKLLG